MKSNLVAFFDIVHWHNGVKPTEPTEQRWEPFAEDTGEAKDVDEDEGCEHVEENQNWIPSALGVA